MTVDKRIKRFFNEINYNKEFLLDNIDWEYEFLISICKSHGVTPLELEQFVVEYKEKILNKKKKKRVIKKLLDLSTGITYPNILDFSKKTGVNRNTAYYMVKRYPERFKLLGGVVA